MRQPVENKGNFKNIKYQEALLGEKDVSFIYRL